MCFEVGFKSSVSPPSACLLATSSTARAQRRKRIVGHIVPGYGKAHTTERCQLILGRDVVRVALIRTQSPDREGRGTLDNYLVVDTPLHG